MLVLLFLSNDRLLRSKGCHRHAHTLIDALIDDPSCLTYDVQAMALRSRDKGNTKKIVLGYDLAHVEAVVETLHSMNRRTSPRLLIRDGSVPAPGKIARDFRDKVRQMIRQSWLVQLQLPPELASLHAPFRDDLLAARGEDLGEFSHSAML